jgi:hypothetical protein
MSCCGGGGKKEQKQAVGGNAKKEAAVVTEQPKVDAAEEYLACEESGKPVMSATPSVSLLNVDRADQ